MARTNKETGEPSHISFFRPNEKTFQAGTMLSWPTESSVIDDDFYDNSGIDIQQTRKEVASIALTIAKYQPVHVFVLDPKAEEDDSPKANTSFQTAKEFLGHNKSITLCPTPNIHSLWARDTGPINLISQRGAISNSWSPTDDPGLGLETKSTSTTTVGLDLHFNQWGRKQQITQDHYLAATACQHLNISCVSAPFVSEGGALEVDGAGTLLATESSILNPNRNPGLDKATLERHLATYLGVNKTIWIPGRRGADITDDHIDSLARFGGTPGTVLLSRAFRIDPDDERDYKTAHDILASAKDAQGQALRVIEVPQPDPRVVLGEDYRPKEGPCVSYVNFLVINGAVIMAKFGDQEKDEAAKKIIEQEFPDRVIEQVYLHQLALQGGGVHCATQQLLPR